MTEKKRRNVKRTKGQGSVFTKPGTPYYHLSYWNGWRQKRESSRTTDHKEALAILQRKIAAVAAGKSAGVERVSISALLELVIDDYRRNDKSDLRETEQRINRLLKPAFGQMRASEFTTKALNAYIGKRKELGRKNATINRELAHLRRAFNLGYKNDPPLVARVPYIPALNEKDNVREGFLEADKYHLILDALTDDVKPVFVVGYHLGMRTGELLALKRSWVDIQGRTIHVNGRATKNKNAKTAPIYGDMLPWLKELLRRGEAESPKCIWLFSRSGKPIKDFRKDWEDACVSAGVSGLLFHDLRRTAVRNMLRAGVQEKVAMQISGHKTNSMLWRYNITNERDIRDAGERTEAYLNAQRERQHAQ